MFAIIRTDESDFDVAAVTTALAAQLGLNATDLAQRFIKSPGILFDSVSSEEAQKCLGLLHQHGVQVEKLPQWKVVQPPSAKMIDACNFSSVDFCCEGTSMPLSDVRWVDLVYLRHVKTVRGDMLSDSGDSHSDPFAQRESSLDNQQTHALRHEDHYTTGSLPRATETQWMPLVDIVPASMDQVLRIDVNRFNFRSTGQKVHPTRDQNIWSLCIGLVNAADSATCGPGLRWIREGGLPQRQRVDGKEFHQNLLSWQLTRISNSTGTEEGPVFVEAVESPDEQSQKIQNLVWLCKTILEDGEISLDEIKELIRWLRQHRNLDVPSVRSLVDVMQRITADKVVTSNEKSELQRAMECMIGAGDY